MENIELKNLEYKKCESYIINKIKNGKNISLSFLNNFNKIPKNIFTYTKPSISIDALYSFEIGEINTYKESKQKVINYIYEFLNKSDEAIVVFENSSFSKGDKWLIEAKSRIITYENEVFHILINRDSNNSELISYTLHEGSNGWQNVIYFSRLDIVSIEKLIQLNALDKGCINEIAKNITSIVVDIYDLDGYLYIEL